MNKDCQSYIHTRVENRPRVFENGALGRIFGPTTDKATEGLRKLHNLYSSLKCYQDDQGQDMQHARERYEMNTF